MKALSILLMVILLLSFSMLLYDKITGHAVIREIRTVTKVIDGDTIVISGGRSVRLIGIDTAEKGEDCFEEAKNRLEELVLNKEVALEQDGENKDKYGRLLRYVFVSGENINVMLVDEGLAIASFYGNKRYAKEIAQAEEHAMENKIGCRWS